jgi:hypothetical protein
MCSHFVNLTDQAVSGINKASHQHSYHPYLSVNLQKAISVQILYDTGADISCLSNKVFSSIVPQFCPSQSTQALKASHGASGKTLHKARINNLDLQIVGQTMKHPIHVIQNLQEDVNLGINFIHAH